MAPRKGKPGPAAGDRLQKVLARVGVASRRKVEDLLREGRITVGGKVAILGQVYDPSAGPILVDGERLDPQALEPLYILVHKAPGMVSTVSDPEGRPTVLDLVPPELHPGLVPVGRLDYHTGGLLILTNDGDFAHRVAHPSHGCSKVYAAKVKGQPTEDELNKLRRGISIGGKRTGPCQIEARGIVKGRGKGQGKGERRAGDTSWWNVTLREGRNRQIREMFLRIGHPVRKLRRIAIGNVRDPDMPMGTFRELTPGEVRQLRAGGGPKPKPKARRAPRKTAAREGTPRGAGPRGPRGKAPRRKSSK